MNKPTRIAIAGAVLAVIATAAVAQTNIYQCVSVEGRRLTRDKEDIRVGEDCTELTRDEVARMKAEANRPPTPAEKAKMTTGANSMNFWDRCAELGRVLRRVGATPRQQFWADAIIAAAQVPVKDQGYIRDRRLRIGKDECSVVAALGKPDALHRTNHAGGRSDQLVYQSKRMYVYTDNGVVRSWQE